jgi:D-alanyl-D-alanine dipeptidase
VFRQIREKRNAGIRFWSLMLTLVPAMYAANSPQHTTALSAATQLIVVTTADWNATSGTLQRFARTAPQAAWHPVGDPIPVVVGKNGLGWGAGMMSVPGHRSDDPVKKEGDRRATAGIFRLGTAFGYAQLKPSSWSMPYLALSPSVECVDDSHSKSYNRVVDRARIKPDWNSSEHMRSEGEYYRWGVVIDQNPGRVPQGGSCVFMHIWGGDGQGTEGCTAMARPNIEAVLAWLDPATHPLLVQMPLQQYRQVEKDLRLPRQ